MKIISHRGYWFSEEEKNKELAFARSFKLGFGTETDLRDQNGEIVISHDMANDKNISFEFFCKIYVKYSLDLPLALNVKADGLSQKIKQLLYKYNITKYFLFDMSIPQLRIALAEDLNCYTRVSDVEVFPSFYGASRGVWLDGFYSDWYRPFDFYRFLRDGKCVCLVSSELHMRDHIPLWQMLKDSGLHNESMLMICTDKPEEAFQFFFNEGR